MIVWWCLGPCFNRSIPDLTSLSEAYGGAQGRSMSDLPGVNHKIETVNGVSLRELVQGNAEKPVR